MFTSRTLLFLTFLVALFAASYAQDCLLYTDCDDCIGESTGTCGWCESTQECLEGNAVGPGGNALNCSEWFFDNCLVPDCDTFTSCTSCLRDPFCGWCESTQLCVEGMRSGPVTGTCSDYIFDRSECPATTTTATTTGRQTTTTGRQTTTTGRRTTTTASATTASTTAASTTGRRTTTTASSSTSGSSTSGSTGRRTTGTTAGTTGGGSTGGRRTTGGSTGTPPPPPNPPPAPATSSTSGQVSSSAYSINSASVFVAIGVVVIALVNLLC